MIFNLCPACRHVNTAAALRCAVCGRGLVEDGDTVPAALLHDRSRAASAGALWFDDLEPPTPAPELASPGAPEAPEQPEEPPLSITLREIDAPPAPPDSAFGRLAASEPASVPVPNEEGLVLSDAGTALEPARQIEVRDSVLASHEADAAARAAAKAARRAAVRRARLGQATGTPGTAVAVPEVMVLDPDDRARALLCTLLGAFGFRVHPVLDVEQATELVAERPFAALFVDVVLDGSDGGSGVEMCRQVKGTRAPTGFDQPVLVLVSSQLRPVDRVRAKLAGCDGMLLKPVARGDVARLLESCGVALPSDARRR